MCRLAHPRHVPGWFVYNKRDLDSVDITNIVQHDPEHITGNDARLVPLLCTLEFIGDLTQPFDSGRTFHTTIVARPVYIRLGLARPLHIGQSVTCSERRSWCRVQHFRVVDRRR